MAYQPQATTLNLYRSSIGKTNADETILGRVNSCLSVTLSVKMLDPSIFSSEKVATMETGCYLLVPWLQWLWGFP